MRRAEKLWELCPENPLYHVTDVFNGVFVHGNMLGDAMFYGSGAGKLPTASAVVADIIDAIRHQDFKKYLNWQDGCADYVIKDYDEVEKYYIILKGNNYDELKPEFIATFGNCFESYVFNEYRQEIAILTKELPYSEVVAKLNDMTKVSEYKILHTML